MRRLLVLGFSVATGLLLFGALLLPMIRSGSMGAAGWRPELDRYMAYRSAAVVGTVDVASGSQATRPSAFDRTMSGLTFGDSANFQTTFAYNRVSARGTKPLLFPPEEVWCVRLIQRRSPAGGGEEVTAPVVFVAKHSDLYSADWVTHEPPRNASAAGLDAMMATLGCQ